VIIHYKIAIIIPQKAVSLQRFIKIEKFTQMKLILLTVGLLCLCFAGIAIKIWAKKDGKFAGTCASQNPMLNQSGEACGFCGKTPDQFDTCTEPQHQNS
jgi:hypothetical protein